MMMPRWVVIASAALLSHSVCAARSPGEWTVCEQPIVLDFTEWSDAPYAQLLASEVSSGAAGTANAGRQAVRLGRVPDVPTGTVSVGRHAEVLDITGSAFAAVARATIAFCNGRIHGHGEFSASALSSARLWAHFVARSLPEDEIAGLVREVAAAGYHGVIIDIGGWLRSNALPGAHEPGALDGDGWVRIVSLARALGLEVVPELKLLTHQQKLLGLSSTYRRLLLNPYTYDPDLKELQILIQEYVGEVVQIFSPRAVHIGHDEVALSNGGLQPLGREARRLAPRQFVQSAGFLDAVLGQGRVETWMWADMLLDPSEFPGLPTGEMNGANGFADTAHLLPKRIVLLDWHYYSPTNCTAAAQWLRRLGFRVMTAGWSRADALQCQLRALEGDPQEVRAEAQIVTTWSYVQKRNWQRVREILRQGTRLYEATVRDRSVGTGVPVGADTEPR